MKQLNTEIDTSQLWIRFTITYACLAAILVAVIYPVLLNQEKNNIQSLINNEKEKVGQFDHLVGRIIKEQISDLYVISKLPILKVYLDSEEESRVYLEGYFKELGEAYQRFEQIRFINTAGQEVLRVNVESGKASLVTKKDLQDKSKRYYFQEAIKLNPGDIYISEPDLNMEHGQVELPRKTVIRFATPLTDSKGKKAGILILNYNANYLINAFRDIYSRQNPEKSVLLDSHAHELFDSTYSHTLSESIFSNWDAIKNNDRGKINVNGGILLYSTIDPINFDEGDNNVIKANDIITKDYPWHFIVYIPDRILWRSSLLHSREGGVIFSLFAILLAIITYYAIVRNMIKKEIMERDVAINRELNFLYEHAPCGYHTIDASGNIVKINQTELAWLKYDEDEVLFRPLSEFLTEASAANLNKYLENQSGSEFPASLEIEMMRKDGSTFYASMSSIKFIDNDGAVLIHSNIVNINERVKLERELEEQANTDYLTGVNNRRNFLENAEAVHRHAIDQDHPLSIVLLDIDHFKKINDTYGHDAGDTVLKWFTSHISDMLRSTDILARFGGEEFILLLPRTPIETAYDIAERIRKKIMNSPISIDDGSTINITVSLGVAEMHEEENINSIIKNADTALYQSKQNGRNRVSSYIRHAA